jgi:hypothetical protein
MLRMTYRAPKAGALLSTEAGDAVRPLYSNHPTEVAKYYLRASRELLGAHPEDRWSPSPLVKHHLRSQGHSWREIAEKTGIRQTNSTADRF